VDDDVEFQRNIILHGDLNILGEINQTNVSTLNVDDTFVILNNGETG